jgi:BirA family biotin operon repressor/biotin-[acetyl-CoA-carboxylase] ligase
MDFATFHRELVDRGHPPPLDNVVCLPGLPSTNTLGRRIAAEYLKDELPVPTVAIVAFEQTAGRGRWGRRWASPAGRGVYASLVVPVAAPAELAALPLAVAVGLAQALDRHLAVAGAERCRLKWPNDLTVGGRKLGGILIDALAEGERSAAVVGFGINHGLGEDELAALEAGGAGAATSLALEIPAPPPLPALVWELVAAVRRQLGRLGDADHAAEAARRYADLSVHRPGDRLRCRAGEETVEGTFLGFDKRGYLRLEVGGEERRLAAGEVSA